MVGGHDTALDLGICLAGLVGDLAQQPFLDRRPIGDHLLLA
jgi:hypothetical protein